MTNTTPPITWGDMTTAGIDIDRVRTRDNTYGGRDYVLTDPHGREVIFGRVVDMTGDDIGVDLGWDVTMRTPEPDGSGWIEGCTLHYDTAAEMLSAVSGASAPSSRART